MAKYYGSVGYATTCEDLESPGVWVDSITERHYYGDVIRNISKWSENTNRSINDNVNVDNKISILADPYAMDNFSKIKYLTYMGEKWKVISIEVQRPRLILTIGGVWNGQT